MPSRSQLALLRRGKEMSDGTGGEAPSGGSGGWPDAGIPATYPNATNTGPTGTLTDVAGDINVTADGQVIEGKRLTNGMIRVIYGGTPHHNVIIRNCEINSQEFFGIDGDSCNNLLVENCRITGVGGQGGILIANDSAVRFCDISGYGNGILWSGDGTLMENNYIHDLNQISGDPHYDGMQTGSCSNTMIRYNTIISKDTSHVFLKNDGGAITHVKVIRNQFLADPVAGTPSENVYVDGRGSSAALVSFVEVSYNFGHLPVGSTTGAFVSAENTANISVHDNTLTAAPAAEMAPVTFFNGVDPVAGAGLFNDTSSNSLGIRIDPIVDGSLADIRFYRAHVDATAYGWVGLWDLVAGELLIGVEWYGQSGIGWKTIPLGLRPRLLATRCYCACVWLRPNASNQIHYRAEAGRFASAGVILPGHVELPPDTSVAVRGYPNRNGMFIQNSPNNVFLMPNASFNGGNYHVDVGWVDGTYPDVPLSGYPNAQNTGFSGSPDALTPLIGDQNITVAGTLFENKDVAGKLYINADNVTVRNCRISAGAGMIGADGVVVVGDGRTGVIIEDTEIYGQDTSDGIKGIWGTGTFRRLNISGCEDGIYFKAGTSVCTDNYIHDLSATGNPSPHTDGLSIDTGNVNTILKHNTVRLAPDATACINITNYGGNVTNLTIEDNVCEGGGNQILLDGRFTNAPGAVISGTTIKNNVHYSFGYAPLADITTTGTVASGTTQIKPPPAGYFD